MTEPNPSSFKQHRSIFKTLSTISIGAKNFISGKMMLICVGFNKRNTKLKDKSVTQSWLKPRITKWWKYGSKKNGWNEPGCSISTHRFK
jgi:hypothetical protein